MSIEVLRRPVLIWESVSGETAPYNATRLFDGVCPTWETLRDTADANEETKNGIR